MMRDRESARSASEETLKDRVRRAFVSGAESYEHAHQAAIAYLGELRSRMKDLSEGIRRIAVLLLLVAAVFQLLDQAAVVGLQAGPFKINDLSIIRRVLPAIFAYLIYDMAVLGVRYLYSINIAIEISKLFQPSIRSNRLDVLLNPLGSPLFGPMLWHRSQSREYRLVSKFMLVLRLGSVLLPLIIEMYAYYRLFEVFGLKDAIIWLSALVSLGFIAFAGLVVLTALRDGLIRPTGVLGPVLNERSQRTSTSQDSTTL